MCKETGARFYDVSDLFCKEYTEHWAHGDAAHLSDIALFKLFDDLVAESFRVIDESVQTKVVSPHPLQLAPKGIVKFKAFRGKFELIRLNHTQAHKTLHIG